MERRHGNEMYKLRTHGQQSSRAPARAQRGMQPWGCRGGTLLSLVFALLASDQSRHIQAVPGTAVAVAPVNVTQLTQDCDRDASRRARHIFTQYVLAPHGFKLDQLPVTCPFHPSMDVFYDHERHKIAKNSAQRQCTYCQKVFKSEWYLDKHLQRKHIDRIPVSATACLAKLCDILHCDWFAAALAAHSTSRRRRTPPVPPSSMLRDDHCMPHEAARTRSACQDLAHHCFPVEVDSGAHHHHALKEPSKHKWDALHDYWTHNFCQAATCAPGAREKLLGAVFTERHTAGLRALWILLLVLAAMALAAGAMCCMSDRIMPRQKPSKGRGARVARAADADPSGKLHRKPHAPPSSTLNQVPYVAKRTASNAAGVFMAGQQILSDAAGSLATSLGVGQPLQAAPSVNRSLQSPQGSTGAPLGSPRPPVQPQVLHAGAVAGHPGSVLHQRAATTSTGGAAGPTHASVGGAPPPPQSQGGLQGSGAPPSFRPAPPGGPAGPLGQPPGGVGAGAPPGGVYQQPPPQPPQSGQGWLPGLPPSGLSGGPLLSGPWSRPAPPRAPDKRE